MKRLVDFNDPSHVSLAVNAPVSRPVANSSAVASKREGKLTVPLYCAYTLGSGAKARKTFAKNQAETMMLVATITVLEESCTRRDDRESECI